MLKDVENIAKRKMHPHDTIYQSVRSIRSLAVVLNYVSEKSEADGDGPGSNFIEGALDAVAFFATQIEDAMDRLLEMEDVERKAREAA